MDQRPKHPITTPKGTAALTVILAVIGVFTPFFTSLQTAQLFAAVALLVIAWLYAEETRDCIKARSGYARLIAPLISMLVIAGVAIGATFLVDSRNEPKAAPPITPKELTDAVKEALGQKVEPYPAPSPLPAPPPPDYRIVIEEPPSRPAPPPSSRMLKTPDEVMNEDGGYARKSIVRMTEGSKAEIKCISDKAELDKGLLLLINQATEMQNAFAYGKDGDKMSSDLSNWMPNVERFFSENKMSLPDVQIVRLASRGQNQRTFLGINQAGYRAWAEMDAKREALKLILDQVRNRSCANDRARAVEKCLEEKTC